MQRSRVRAARPQVVDGGGGLIGWGVYNPHSMYRVRLLATDEPSLLDHRDVSNLLHHRLQEAADLRRACGLPSDGTTAYRLVNSEGDRLSGLTVDVFGTTAVAVTSALWLEQRQDEVVAALGALPMVDEVVWRRSDGRLQQDGWEPPPKRLRDQDAPPEPQAPRPEPIQVKENGLIYLVSPALGQKSGFYCDQRDNRRLLAEACTGKRVLDLFCYSGGFALAAAKAGAASCVAVDSSSFALELARRNAAINDLDDQIEFVQADVHKYLKGLNPALRDSSQSDGPGPRQQPSGEGPAPVVETGAYDVVICDPPKLAPSFKDLPRATRKYKQLNANAMRAITPRGGLLLSCTCSAAMTQSGSFLSVLHEAAQQCGRAITVLRVAGAAPCHVINPGAPESEYLTAVLLHVR